MEKLPPDIKARTIEILTEQEYILRNAYCDYNYGKHCYCLTGAIGAACGLHPSVNSFSSDKISEALSKAAGVPLSEAYLFLFGVDAGANDHVSLIAVNDTTRSMEELIQYVQTNL